jgi:hypothetical protein
MDEWQKEKGDQAGKTTLEIFNFMLRNIHDALISGDNDSYEYWKKEFSDMHKILRGE